MSIIEFPKKKADRKVIVQQLLETFFSKVDGEMINGREVIFTIELVQYLNEEADFFYRSVDPFSSTFTFVSSENADVDAKNIEAFNGELENLARTYNRDLQVAGFDYLLMAIKYWMAESEAEELRVQLGEKKSDPD